MQKHLKAIFQNRKPRPEGFYREFAVLVPLVAVKGELHLLFEVRSESLKNQPKEICFPGGKMESGENPVDCAVRETCEELNIAPEQIEIYGPLDYLVMYHNMILYPFLGCLSSVDPQKIQFNRDEVSDVFTVPLQFFIETKPIEHFVYNKTHTPEDFPFHMIPNGRNYPWHVGKRPVLFYPYQNQIIWGMTARIINNLVHIIS